MRYLVAMCLLAAPLAVMAAPTPADAAPRGVSCHWVKKAVWSFGKKRYRLVRSCTKRNTFHARRFYRARQHYRRWH